MFSEGGALVNRHHFSDNLNVPRDHIATESVGLVDIDPLFNLVDCA